MRGPTGGDPYIEAGTNALRVLLVEDSALLSARLGELIGRLPDVEFIGCEAAEGEAIRRIAESRPDVLILDLQLRKGSGFGVLRALLGSNHYPKAIVLTNYATAEYRRQAELLGVAAFLDKARDVGRLSSLLLNFAEEHRRPIEPR